MSELIIKRNERSWVISMISDINVLLQSRTWLIKKAGGETTINTGNNVMFPDLLLYGDIGQKNILQGWEIKMPDVSITDNIFINDAQRKANILGLNSFFLWNFTYGVLYTKDNDGNFNITKSWKNTKHIVSREDVETYQHDWKALISDILAEINNLLFTGELYGAKLDIALSDKIMPFIIENNKQNVADVLKNKAVLDTRIESTIEEWWDGVKKEYMSDEVSMYCAYAKTVLLNWLNRITFAHLIKKYHTPASKVQDINNKTISPKLANLIFEEITAQCDFYNVFSSLKYNEFLSDLTWQTLLEYNMFLTNNNIDDIDQVVLQNILENTVKEVKRAIIGQFTTPQILAKLLVNITVIDKTGQCIDPCCGTGTIPKEIIKYKEDGVSVEQAYRTTWASDKYSFPLQVSNISLTTQESMNIPCRIFKSNVFEINIEDKIDIVDPKNGTVVQYTIPEFDAVVSNLPFVDFNKNHQDNITFTNRIVDLVQANTNVTLSRRNDLYSYIIFKLWDVLKIGGRIGLITSNSWLGTDAGKLFFEALRWYYDIDGIYISGAGKWFGNADVMSTLLVMTKKVISTPSLDKNISFNIIKSPICKWNDEKIFKSIKRTALLSSDSIKNIITVSKYTNKSIDDLLSLNISINTIFHNVTWLLNIKDKMCKVNTLFTPFRGEKTGQDEVFYLNDSSVVDSEFIIKGLKNSRNCNKLMAFPDTNVLWCDKSLQQLQYDGKEKTISWLNRFKDNLNLSVQKRTGFWYDLTCSKTTQLFTGMNPGERIFFGMFEEPTFINQRLIGFTPNSKNVDIYLCHALLNSMLGIFYIEAIGFGRGLGALDFSKDNLSQMFMLNPQLITTEQRNIIIDKFDSLKKRDILSTTAEFNMPDRQEFDHAILSAYGIDDYYELIKSTILSMQKVRLSVKDR